MWNSLILATVVVLAAAAVPQTRPDFSGKWTSEPEPTAASGRREEARSERAGDRAARGDMGSGWSSNITIAQEASRLSVEYVFFARGDMQPPLKFIYALDGSETKNTVMMGRGVQVQTSKTAWVGDKLVITTVHTFTHPETGKPMTSEVKQTLFLDSSSSLVLETTRSGVLGGPSSTTRTIYRKHQGVGKYDTVNTRTLPRLESPFINTGLQPGDTGKRRESLTVSTVSPGTKTNC